ncbi:hypothetical protein [[Mycobacterium] nativiensis]|uniref:Uncharacterized protein n=1 Tax=[Mycobacterium] nativiensis TaxID=2855503 RepID=A0ABU5Y4U2_9MYCO|nr:hypothetical protein [Mycolicibacter sp. MYC340]MEB3035082.1 hypothetical protein [Mycolicibacter sp. MYC340]
MTAAPDFETVDAPGLAQLEQRLQIRRGNSIAVVNAPVDSVLRLLAVSRANPHEADVVIAFATRRRDLALLKPAYRAAGSDRTSWVVYPQPGQPGTDLRWGWFLAALRQYGVTAAAQVAIDANWSAVLLQQTRRGEADTVLVGYPNADPGGAGI